MICFQTDSYTDVINTPGASSSCSTACKHWPHITRVRPVSGSLDIVSIRTRWSISSAAPVPGLESASVDQLLGVNNSGLIQPIKICTACRQPDRRHALYTWALRVIFVRM